MEDLIYSFTTGSFSLGSCSQVVFRAFTATLVTIVEYASRAN